VGLVPVPAALELPAVDDVADEVQVAAFRMPKEFEEVRCLAAGADDYVLKPLSPQVYIEKLWRLYTRSRG